MAAVHTDQAARDDHLHCEWLVRLDPFLFHFPQQKHGSITCSDAPDTRRSAFCPAEIPQPEPQSEHPTGHSVRSAKAKENPRCEGCRRPLRHSAGSAVRLRRFRFAIGIMESRSVLQIHSPDQCMDAGRPTIIGQTDATTRLMTLPIALAQPQRIKREDWGRWFPLKTANRNPGTRRHDSVRNPFTFRGIA